MNVAIFTDNDFEKVNGVTTVLRAVLEYAPAGLHVRVFTCDADGADRPNYFSARSAGVGIPFYSEMKMYAPPIGRFLRQARADRVDLIHMTTPGPVGLAALWVASRLRLPLVGSFHTHLAEYTTRLSGSARLGAVMREYQRCLYNRCSRILAPSEATRRVLVESRIEVSKIGIWSRGVSTERFTPAKRSMALRRQWRVADDCPVLLYVGRLSREKGLADLLPVQRALAQTSVPHRLVFVGDGPMRAELHRACPEAVFTGSLKPDDVATAMASADVFLFPSRTDTAGNVVLEAQASGLPVLVTNEGGPQEHMRPGVSGEVCVDVMELTLHASRLCTHVGLREKQSASARQFALGRRWDLSLEPLFQLYQDVGRRERAQAPLGMPQAIAD